MKNKIILLGLTLIAFFGLAYFTLDMTFIANEVQADLKINPFRHQSETQTYFIDVPPNLDTIRFSAKIDLVKNKKRHIITMPNGGTETNVFLFDSTFADNFIKNVQLKPIAQGNFALKEQVYLDISNLKPGRYYVHYLSCNFGGIFQVYIKTNH